MKEEKKQKKKEPKTTTPSVSPPQAFLVHLVCGLGLAAPLWVAHNLFSLTLVSDPSSTLRLIWVVKTVVMILVYSSFRQNPEQCSYSRAVGRGILALPVGALVSALGAMALGAPVGSQYLAKTINWSLFMSSLTVICARGFCIWLIMDRLATDICTYQVRPNGALEYMICIPAHGAIIGGWLGAWPMPLDWERPWQEWPICVTYGAIMGYLVSTIASFGFVVAHRRHRLKGD
ncbi:hypothetical protein Tsubulata_002968 [Turnera subulata]|uniref:Glycosylphosphatidylinositol anchor biosynthesis protein 11 n=1 Tax=Turnera subulata TaxID=218843 RepID=A0A9Q0FYE2_9ROSI|nr:hypothetical protein Tsubulata_002968 [Turnera subulata]